jgi:PadR family transcriptional regulator, regulatory protein AphA
LADGARSGYELTRLIDQSIGFLWSPSRSQIYRVLPRLVERDLAQSREVEQQGRPDKALYSVTDAGRRALRGWLEEVEVEPASRTIYVLKLFFCKSVPSDTALAQLAGYRRFLDRLLARYEEIAIETAQVANIYERQVLGHGIARVRGTLAWIDEAEAALEAAEPSAGRAASSPNPHSRSVPH